MEEIKIALHIHSIYSDGNGTHAQIVKAAQKTGLDALIITDHNLWVDQLEAYHQTGKHKTMLLIGEEVHDTKLAEGKNHMLIFGAGRELSPFAASPQLLIHQARQSGALTFLAHPIEDPLPMFGEKSFSWQDWEISDFSGIELWNQMSEFKSRSNSIWKALLHALFPKYLAQGPLERTLFLWDKLLSMGKPVVAIGGVDAHQLKFQFGPVKFTLYPYEFQFRSLTTHLLLTKPLGGDFAEDKRLIFEALKLGHAFVAYDLPYPTHGFRFTVDNKFGEFHMGDQVSAQGGLTFQVHLPTRAHCRLLRDGTVIKETTDREVLTHITSEKGVYRAEVYIHYLGRERGWIFSNPIYATD